MGQHFFVEPVYNIHYTCILYTVYMYTVYCIMYTVYDFFFNPQICLFVLFYNVHKENWFISRYYLPIYCTETESNFFFLSTYLSSKTKIYMSLQSFFISIG